MRIYFCDKCNESIPLKDMQTNRITIDENKIYCAACAPRPSRVKQFGRALYAFALPAVLCVGLGMIVMALWGEKLMKLGKPENVQERVERVESTVNQRLDRIEAGIKVIDGDLEETPGIDQKSGKLARTVQSLKDNAAAIQTLLHDFNTLRDDVKSQIETAKAHTASAVLPLQEESAKRSAVIDRIDRDGDKARAEIEALRTAVDRLSGQLAGLEASRAAAPRPAAETSPAPVAPAAVPAGEAALTPAAEKKLEEALKRLADKEPSKRFSAVFDLADVKGTRAEKALVGALADSVDYIQQAAIGCLADLGAKWTVPLIAPRIKDDNQFIREAAIGAVEKLTGMRLDVREDSGATKLAQKVKDVEKWWQENKAKIANAELSGK